MKESAAESPFICAYLLDRSGGGRALDEAGARNWQPGDGLLWVHLDVLRDSSQRWLADEGGIGDIAAEVLGAGETRPRVLSGEDGLLLVLRGVNMNPGADPEDMVSIRLWLQRDRIVTSRRRRLLAITNMRDEIEQGNAPRSPGEFLARLVEKLAIRIGDIVDEMETEIDGIEDAMEQRARGASPSAVSAMRRQAAAVRRYLAPQRDALDRLYRDPGSFLTRDETQELREQADRMTRYLEDLDLVRERAMVLQEEYLSRLAYEQNARVYLLSVVAAIFLPLSFLTGLLGMNVAGLPGTENPAGFAWSAGLMVTVGAGLAAFFRWKRWI